MTVTSSRDGNGCRSRRWTAGAALLFLALAAHASAQAPIPQAVAAQTVAAQSTQDLKRLSLQDLMNLEISTVTRAPEPSALVPAAVHVITADDIRRSGATSLPEVLRLAPGLHVARIDAARYAVGVRGFSDRLARSMLVMIDGRAVYSPLFAGTYWEVQDAVLEDIDRIEIIRGPGGTLWGANAVHGIINIVTRAPRDTQGVLASAVAGTDARGLGSFRYGWRVGERGHARAYVKALDRAGQDAGARPEYDVWRMVQAGFRTDLAVAGERQLTVQGDAYVARLGQLVEAASFTPPFEVVSTRESPIHGGNVLARWSGPMSGGTDFRLQTFYDRTRRDERPVAETRDTFDVDFQHRLRPWGRHDVTWGAGYRLTADRLETAPLTTFSPDGRTDHLASAFLQDEVTLVPERLEVTLGSKIERNSYSGLEWQPSARLIWRLNPASSLLASATRAVRTPSRVETDYLTNSLVSPAPVFVRLLPNPDFVPEKVIAYELGYRVRPTSNSYVTVAGFFNDLDDLLSTELFSSFVETSPGPPRVILPVSFLNGVHGNSHGVEVTADVRPSAWWRTTAGYSLLRAQITKDPGSRDVTQERNYEGRVPRHQVQLQTSIDLPRRVTLDWFFRYVSALSVGPVPAYDTSTLRIAWQPTDELELAVVGRNLHDARHLEWPEGFEIERAGLVSLTWRVD